MTNPTKAHLTLVCDRSGSMDAVQHEAQQGVNTLIDDQKALTRLNDLDITLLLVDFDTIYQTRHHGNILDFGSYKLEPLGMTALLDAVGRAIVDTGRMLEAMAEDDRPAKVVFAVQTDGLENSSQEYTNDRILTMVKEQEEKYGWQFMFLGMGADTWDQARQMGIHMHTNSARSGQSVGATYANTSAVVSDYYSGAETVDNLTSRINVDVDDDGNVTQR